MHSDPRFCAVSHDDYKKSYFHYYRQYTGVINQAGERIVFIQLFKCCRRIRSCYLDWQRGPISIRMDSDCAISSWFDVNLTKKRISVN